MECKNYQHARQVGDLTRQDRVGCVLLSNGEIKFSSVNNSGLYEGYIYFNRSVKTINHLLV